jgi:hypothetical protein
MDYLFNKIKSIPEITPPQKMHKKIMQRVLSPQLKGFLLIIVIFFIISCLTNFWHITNRIIETDAISTFQAILSVFTLDIESFSILFNFFVETFHPSLLIMLAVNIFAAFYLFVKRKEIVAFFIKERSTL